MITVEGLLGSLSENEAVMEFSLNERGHVVAYETRFFWAQVRDLQGDLLTYKPDVAAARCACVLRGRQ